MFTGDENIHIITSCQCKRKVSINENLTSKELGILNAVVAFVSLTEDKVLPKP